jgi:hypothetical protein
VKSSILAVSLLIALPAPAATVQLANGCAGAKVVGYPTAPKGDVWLVCPNGQTQLRIPHVCNGKVLRAYYRAGELVYLTCNTTANPFLLPAKPPDQSLDLKKLVSR